jgi:hypothetical protein
LKNRGWQNCGWGRGGGVFLLLSLKPISSCNRQNVVCQQQVQNVPYKHQFVDRPCVHKVPCPNYEKREILLSRKNLQNT